MPTLEFVAETSEGLIKEVALFMIATLYRGSNAPRGLRQAAGMLEKVTVKEKVATETAAKQHTVEINPERKEKTGGKKPRKRRRLAK